MIKFKNNEICQEHCINEDVVDSVVKKMLPRGTFMDLADLFKILGDNTRIRIIYALYHSELCVCDLVSVLNMSQSSISHQLRLLRASKIVNYRKEGKNVYYSLDDNHIENLFKEGLDHVKEDQ